MGFLKVRGTGAVGDKLLTLMLVVLSCLQQQDLLELLLVQFPRILAHLDQHLHRRADLSLFDDLAFALLLDLFDEKLDQSFLDRWIHNHVMLELTVLHVFD